MSFSEWKKVELKEVIDFNPRESLPKNQLAKKVAMEKIKPFSKFIDDYEIAEFKGGTKFRNQDTLLARITPCLENGKTSQVTLLEDNEIGFGSTEYIVMRKKTGITDKDYIFYLAISPSFREVAIKSMVGSSGRQRVQQDELENLQINLPPLQEQKAIAATLSCLDDKIELNNRMNKNLEEMAQAIFKSWFVDFEPFQDGEFEESELGMIPKGWRVGTIGEILSEIEAGNRPKGGVGNLDKGIPSIGAENIIGLGKYDYAKEKFVSYDYFKSMNKGVVKNWDVLLYKDGAQLGRKTMFASSFPHKECCINSHVFILRSKGHVSQQYLYFWLDQDYMTQNIVNLNTNSAQPGINQPAVKSLKILIPDQNTNQRFQYIIEKQLVTIFENCLENRKLQEIRDTLLPKLMSGEIRVPIEEVQ